MGIDEIVQPVFMADAEGCHKKLVKVADIRGGRWGFSSHAGDVILRNEHAARAYEAITSQARITIVADLLEWLYATQ